jgi:hypothetical protein
MSRRVEGPNVKRLTCSCGAGQPQADVDAEREFLLQQVVGDGIDAHRLAV